MTSLGSGSSGNAFLVRSGNQTLMIDCGIGVRRMARVLAIHGLAIGSVDAVLLSHEHSDHVRELPRFVAAGTPVLCTRGTAAAARVPASQWTPVSSRAPRSLGDIEIAAIPVSHDAAEPCGFLVRTRAGCVTILTDLGRASGPAREAITESDLVILEANHDEAVLRRGPYPLHLQRRILSDSGHLSNTACAELLASALRGVRTLPDVWLAHLSETNNRPLLAVKTVEQRLAQGGFRPVIQALPRREASAEWQPGTRVAAEIQLTLGFK